MSITINPPAGPWTIEDLARLPDAGYRFEIHEGNLVMLSPVKRWHSRVARRLANVLEAAGQQADTEIGVKKTDQDMRVPDVAVLRPDVTDLSRSLFDPDEVILAVEIVSNSSKDSDRVNKPRWYARAGIAEYWRVEQGEHEDGAVIYQYKLARTADGEAAYVETGVTTLEALERPK